MSKEIRKETDWLGREKDVIYESGKKVGETRHETTIFGTPKDVTYNTKGNKVSETRHETTIFGTSKEVTRDTHGNKISETRYEEGIFGGKKGIIREGGKKIGELKTEKGIFGGRKQVLHESGEDVDLTRRVTRKEPTRTEYSTRSYTTRDSSASQLETMPIPKLVKWLIGLGIVGALSIGVQSYINNSQSKQSRLETSVKRTNVNQALQNRDKKIKESLDAWISNNLNYPPVRDIGGLEYPVKISLEDYSVVGKNIWAACYRQGYRGRGHLIYSGDGGENWEILWRDDRTSLHNVYFFDDYKGLMATDGQILKSTNGGRTWGGILYVGDIPTPAIKIIDSINVKNEGNISVRLRGDVNESIETNNGGRTWEYILHHSLHYGSHFVKFITCNGGRSWENVIKE